MAQPRTPFRSERYGPVGGVAGGAVAEVMRTVGGDGGSGATTKNSFNLYSIPSASNEDLIADDILVERARRALERAERKGDGMVEMEEREWGAWQRHVAIEEEVERRVAERMERERLETERRRLVTVPTSSPRLSTRSVGVAAPGILTGDGFAAIGGVLPRQSARKRLPDPPVIDDIPDTESPLSPLGSLAGAFPGDLDPEPRLMRSSVRHIPPAPLDPSSSTSQLVSDPRSSPVSGPRDMPTRPGYYPSKYPTLASRSETDIASLPGSDDCVGSVSALSAETLARRRKREELRKHLER